MTKKKEGFISTSNTEKRKREKKIFKCTFKINTVKNKNYEVCYQIILHSILNSPTRNLRWLHLNSILHNFAKQRLKPCLGCRVIYTGTPHVSAQWSWTLFPNSDLKHNLLKQNKIMVTPIFIHHIFIQICI